MKLAVCLIIYLYNAAVFHIKLRVQEQPMKSRMQPNHAKND